MAKDVVFIHHKGAQFREFRSPTGLCGRWVEKKAQEVATAARVAAPKPGASQGYATGETALSIKTKGPEVGRRGPEASVLSDTDHAVFVHEGTAPHMIRPRTKPQLVFFWRKAGRVVRMDKVRHPGTRPNPFLLNALRSVFGGPAR